MEMQRGIVTIKGPAVSRTQQTKNGPRTVFEQPAQFESEGCRFQFPLGVDSAEAAYKEGTYEWDAVADVVPSQYGPELARRMTLVPIEKFKSAATPAGK